MGYVMSREEYEDYVKKCKNERHLSSFNYRNGDRSISANIDSSHVACTAVGLIAGAAAGIYIYKKYFSK